MRQLGERLRQADLVQPRILPLVRGRSPHNRQEFIAGTRKLLGTTTPNHNIGLGPQAADGGLGDHRGRGGVGNEEEGLQTDWGDAQILKRLCLQTFSQPIYSQCHPQDLHGDPRDRAARAKAAVSQARRVSFLQGLTPVWACRSQHPALAGPRGGQKDKASAPD